MTLVMRAFEWNTLHKIIIIIASHEDEMNDKYNDKLCTSNEVISEMSEEI